MHPDNDSCGDAEPGRKISGSYYGESCSMNPAGISMDAIDNAALRGVFDMLQSHYPER